MTSQFELPVLIFLNPSPWLTGGIIVVHLVAATSLLTVDLNVIAVGAVLLAITASLIQTVVTRMLRLQPDTPVQLMLTAGEGWWLTCANGQSFPVELLPAAFVHPLLTVLSFRACSGRRYSVIITPDVVDTDMFRRLRVRLRFIHDRKPESE